jgi:uncharacterized protein (TIGR02145 family)
MAGAHMVSENPLPINLSFTPATAAICNGQSATLTAVATGGASYSINGNTWQTTTAFNVAPTSNASYTLYVRTAAGCSVTEANAAVVTVNALPTVISSAGASRCDDGTVGTVTLTATPSADAVIDWYDAATNGSVLSDGSATNSFTTPSISATTVYYAEARIATTGCVSSPRTAVTATVNTVPSAPTGLSSNPAAICNGVSTPATLTASVANTGSGAVYEWGTGNTIGASSLGTSAGNTYSVSLSVATTYWVRLRGTDACSVTTTDGATISVTANAPPTAPTMGGNGSQCGGTRSITASYGSGGNGIRWTDDSSTVTPRSVSITGTYYAVTRSAAGCESAAASVSVTIYTAPSISHSGGAASQSVNQGAAITTIRYTASNATSISRSGSTFPSNLSGTTSGLVHTISGTPNTAGVFSYTVTTSNSNGCTNASASGTITVAVGTPQYAASTKTWVVGTQTWSDVIRVPACNKTDYSANDYTADCRNGSYGYFYSARYVSNNSSTLCPSPWRVPTTTDFCTLDKTLFGTTTCTNRNTTTGYTTYTSSRWGGNLAGSINGNNTVLNAGSGRFTALPLRDGNSQYSLFYSNTGVLPISYSGNDDGNQVRCVR